MQSFWCYGTPQWWTRPSLALAWLPLSWQNQHRRQLRSLQIYLRFDEFQSKFDNTYFWQAAVAQYAIPAILASPVGAVIAGGATIATGIFGLGYYLDRQNQARQLEIMRLKMLEDQWRYNIGCSFALIGACMVCYLSFRHPGNFTVS